VFSHTLECRYHIHKDTIVLDGLQRISRNDINGTTKDLRKLVSKAQNPQDSKPCPMPHIDNDIDIAFLIIIPPCHRTKDARVKDTARPQLHLAFTKRL
jgi:hypothetical protein